MHSPSNRTASWLQRGQWTSLPTVVRISRSCAIFQMARWISISEWTEESLRSFSLLPRQKLQQCFFSLTERSSQQVLFSHGNSLVLGQALCLQWPGTCRECEVDDGASREAYSRTAP